MSPIAAVGIVTAAIAAIYAGSTSGYFFEDDFHWLVQAQAFEVGHLVDLSRYSHFYRPVIEVYFYVGLVLFGCNPLPFHLASIAVHLLTTATLYGLARTLFTSRALGGLSAALFAVQPGFTDAVTWIAAITDLLPVLWYILALWMHLLFLQGRRTRHYLGTLAAFALCHLTHESSATLLPMMLATEFTFEAPGGLRARLTIVARHATSYLPYAVALAGYLVLAYVVNTRSYLVQEGHYAFGLHAVPNILNYVIVLYVGKRTWIDYLAVCLTIGLLAWRGNPRTRFFLAWIVVTLLPVAFFTWGNAPRYLYLPAAGFAMLLAELLRSGRVAVARHASASTALAVVVAVAVVLAVRFAVFAKKAADSSPQRTLVYARLVDEVRRSGASTRPGGTVYVDQRFFEGVPEIYREPAVRVGLCLPDTHLQLR